MRGQCRRAWLPRYAAARRPRPARPAGRTPALPVCQRRRLAGRAWASFAYHRDRARDLLGLLWHRVWQAIPERGPDQLAELRGIERCVQYDIPIGFGGGQCEEGSPDPLVELRGLCLEPVSRRRPPPEAGLGGQVE